ncbi:MAG: tetratricopeptide repeat protein [Anaerolineae bacterium]|nr:tetratricopeptide repeat protein [Anaerolineae bacterium]
MNTNQNQSGSIERPAFPAETIADLRELLGQVKRRVDHLPGSGAEAQTLLFQLDAIQELFTRLQGAGADLRAEATRLESIESALRSQDAVLLRELKDAGGLATLRAAANPTRERWWWFLDEGLAQRQKGQKGRILKTVGIVVAVLLIAGLLYRFVLQPEATTTTVMEMTSQARDALAEGDLAGATLAYRQAVEVQPDTPELHAWIGVLEEMQGNAEAAAEAYADAERLAGSPARFYVLRGTARSEAGALDLAIADAQAALAIEPDSAEAHLLLGGVYETQGETAKALQSLQQAAELADASGNAALTAAIRVRLGMLSQKAPELPTLSATASP